jgi:hypothetical protein
VLIYLANAALKEADYDLDASVAIAARERFAGVQLYLGKDNQNDLGLLDRVATKAQKAGLGVIVHLPPKVTRPIARAARRLLQFEPQPRAIAHYDPRRQVPEITGVQIGLENAVVGLDRRYYRRLLAERRSRATFLAFDVPRLFARARADRASVYSFAKQMLDALHSDDVLHLIDQRRPGNERANWCVLGDGLLGPLLPDLAAHSGPIVLEFETLHDALESKKTLERQAT